MKDNKCTDCGVLTNAATDLQGDATPSKDDISLCFYCGAINQFDEDLNIVEMPEEVLEDIKANEPETYSLLIDAVIKIKANNKR